MDSAVMLSSKVWKEIICESAETCLSVLPEAITGYISKPGERVYRRPTTVSRGVYLAKDAQKIILNRIDAIARASLELEAVEAVAEVADAHREGPPPVPGAVLLARILDGRDVSQMKLCLNAADVLWYARLILQIARVGFLH